LWDFNRGNAGCARARDAAYTLAPWLLPGCSSLAARADVQSALVPDIDDAALNVLATHLRCLHRNEEPSKLPKEVMHHFRVIAAEPPWFRRRLREVLR